jgi:hypothetical protein
MDKVDFKKELKQFYSPKNRDWELIEVPKMNFLMIDGKGDPNTTKEYQEAVEALFSVSYAVKFMSKRELNKDYGVSVLEGLWYADDMSIFEAGKKDEYKWTMMIMQPDWIMQSVIDKAIAQVEKKKGLPALPKLYAKEYEEGLSMQLLHIGSYDDEAPKLAYLHHELMPSKELDFNGLHHEIYLSDPRRVASEKLKTILRQPVR